MFGEDPVITVTSPPSFGDALPIPVTLLATTLTAPHTAPPSGVPQLAAMPVMPAGTASAKVAPSAVLGARVGKVSVYRVRPAAFTDGGPLFTRSTSATSFVVLVYLL